MMKRLTSIISLLLLSLFFAYGQFVKTKTFLQGAYQGSSMMNTKLNPIIPYSQPYDTLPWEYYGNETLSSIPANMVDWVLVELRESSFPHISVARRAALLLDNGIVADVDLSLNVSFASTPPGNYYLCVYHRNHLPVMSANPVSLPNNIPYDFSDTINFPPFGGGDKALIELEPGIFGMIAGDANRDGTIKYSGPGNDRGVILQYILQKTGSTNITATVNGYTDEDVVMDSIIRYSGPNNDPSIIIQNLVGLTGSPSITSTYNTTVPSVADPFQCGDSLLDLRDGNKYATAIIGSQCWMAENLAYLPLVRPSNQGSNVLPYYYVYSYEGTNAAAAKTTVNYQTYGVLYNWSAAMSLGASSNNVPSGVQGVCPEGWHLPGDEEWKILEGEVDSQYSYPDPQWDVTGWRGTDAGGSLKEAGTVHWDSPNAGATNINGFNALPGGLRGNSGSFLDLGKTVLFWSSLEDNSYNAWGHGLYYTKTTVRRYNYLKEYGVSVRCVWDSAVSCTPMPTQSNAGPDTIGIMADSIILQGNFPLSGTGVWRIISGIDGVLADSSINNTVFYGQQCNVYLLTWTISTVCGSSTDTVMIRFGDIPFNCGDTLIDNRDGRFYKTVMIGDHCWMAENLNYGIRIDASQQQTDNGIIEKHCYNDDELYCDTLGALYQWDELMQYSTEAGVRGLCPAGWHIPTDDEWKNLEGSVDSQYGVGDTIWDITSWRGYDVGKNIKSLSRWVAGGNGDDLYGFTVLPAGRSSNSAFDFFGQKALFWTSNEVSSSSVRHRILSYEKDDIQRASFYKTDGRSVRCILNPSPCNNLDLSINNGESDTICSGDTSFLNVYVSGGMPPYNYAWSNGNTESSQKVTPSTTSAYTVTVTDALNNSDSDTIMVVVNPTPVADAGVDTTICLGKKAIIGGTTTGGTPPYHYSWNYGHTSSLIDTLRPSITTTYTVTATDGNGCTDKNDVTVTVLPTPTVYAGVDDTICDLMKIQIGDSVVGGIPPYTFEWSNDSITLSQTVSPDWTTTYTITVSDANHCKDIDTVKIMVTPTPVLKLGPDDTICKGDTIMIGAEAESGYPPYEYMWYDFYPYQSSYYYREVTPQVSTTYILFVEDAVGCITSDTITIWVNPAPKAHAGSDTSFCGPQTNVLTGSVATEGTPPYEYLWSTNVTTYFINVDVSTTTSYTVTVTDSNGCKDEDTVTIVIHPIPHADAGDDRTICKGYTTIIGEPASGGTSPYSYLWNDLTTTYSDTVTPLITTIYTVTVTDTNQCTDSDEVAVTVIDVFVDAGPDQYDLCDTAWLMANDPDPYNGYWQIVEGDTNAVFSDTTDPNAYFIGSLDSSYLLSWTIFDTVCNNYYSDSVWIHYAPRATIADAGPDQLVNGISTNLDGNEAIVGIGKWTIVEGTDGHVVNPKNEKSVFRGMVDSTYKLEWQIAGICDTTRDTVMIIFNDPCLGYTSVTGLYGNTYNIVAIGNQCWMAENLNVGQMLNTQYDMHDNDTIEKYCYDNIAINCDAYGGLYHWDELMNYDTTRGGRGICPCGWHVPTDMEWQILEGFSDSIYGVEDPIWNYFGVRGSDVAFNLKETGTIHWLQPNDSATNSTGFTALPGGAVNPATGFWGYGELAVFWTSSKPTAFTNAITRSIRKRDYSYVYGGRIGRFTPDFSDDCFSVRCIKDIDSMSFYAYAGTDTVVCDTAWLTANDPGPYKGIWEIIKGDTNGVFSDTTDPNAYFIGSRDSSYLLSWTIIDTVCNIYDSDSVWVHFAPNVTIADAGPDQTVIGASTNLDGNEALIGVGEWIISEGTNGHVVDPNDEKSVFKGMVDSTYHLIWQILNPCDTTRDTVMIVFIDPCHGENSVTDLDGNIYNIVAIGSQCWMAENLNVGRMLNTPYNMSDNDTTEKYCYDNIAANCDVYGGLYHWDELMNYDTTRGGRGICPCGWHVPTDLEWQILEGFSDSIYGIGDPVWNYNGIRGSDVAFNLKETGTIHWLPPNDSATNSTGFTALPGGNVHHEYGFYGLGKIAGFWTSNKPDISLIAIYRLIRNRDNDYRYGGRVGRFSPAFLDECYSVRCIQDSDPQPFYADAGPDQYDLCDTAWLSANDPGPYLGYWKVIIGDTAAVFSDTTDPKAYFIGSRDSSYLLSWTIIDTVCNIYDSDSVWIFYAQSATIADAGPDQLIVGTSTNLNGNEALVGDGKWFILEGVNGELHDSSYEKSMFDGMIDSSYLLVWQISAVCDTTRDTVMIIFVDPCQGDTSATDPDGNIYKIVPIGSQCWMAENLNVGRMINTQYDMSDNDTTEKYCYDDIATNCDIYGGLYQWDELMNYDTARAGMGICPFGWHVPTDEEWKILEGAVDNTYGVGDPEWDKIYYRGDDAGDNLKAVDSVLWNTPNSNTDASGFKALPGGRVGNYHYSMGIGDFTYLWSSTKYFTAPSSLYRCFFHSVPGVDRHYFSNDYGLSVRCIRDTCQPMPSIADAGPDQDDICDTAWLAANDPSPYIGYWEIIIGDTGAVFSDITDHNAFFIGSLDSSYLLTWTLVDTICLYQQSDSVWIRYAPSVTIADAGADQTNVSGTSTNLDGNQALKGSGTWIIAEGTNGNVVNPVYEKSIFYGMTDSTYRLVWQISNFCDTTRDTVIIVLGHDTIPPCPGVGTVTDQDGNVYNTVQIGDQCWMRENLKVGKMINGNYINGPPKVPQTNNDTIEKYCYYNSPDSCEIYGALYTWWEAMDYDTSRKSGICPYGWHIPTDDEWKILEGTVDSLYGVGDPEWDKSGERGYDAGYALKEAGTKHWYNIFGNDGTNSSGFTALPAGYIWNSFGEIGNVANFWTSTIAYFNVTPDVYLRGIGANKPTITRAIPLMGYGYSVRCIKNCEPQPSSPDAGPDSLNIITDSIVLMGNTPQTGTGHWDIISGIGGILSDPADPTSTFFGQRGETYLLRWTISTICYDSIDEVILKFINPPCPDEPLINYMGQTYTTVLIGDQCWMAENLNVGQMINSDYDMSDNDTIEKYCYDDIEANCNIYGGLYNWDELMQYTQAEGSHGICPPHWYIPSDEEWKILEGTVDHTYGVGDPEWDDDYWRGDDGGDNLKAIDNVLWDQPNSNTNKSGFNALPGGRMSSYGSFSYDGDDAYFWTSTEYSSYASWYRDLDHSKSGIYRNDLSKSYSISVRCIRDTCLPYPIQADAGPDSLDIQSDSVILYANVPVNGTGTWSIISGIGGSFNDSTSPDAVFYGISNLSYVLRWTISTVCGSTYDEVSISFAQKPITPCPGIPTVSYSGQVYNTVLIGTQCWMRENLNVGAMINIGTAQLDNQIIEKYCYDDDSSNCDIYGGLYRWKEMMDYETNLGARGICPPGWHIPTPDEFDELVNYLGGSTIAGGKMKEFGFGHWNSPNSGASNDCGFTALGSGYALYYGATSLKEWTYFWASESISFGYNGRAYYLKYDHSKIIKSSSSVNNGNSVRCLKDD